MRYGLVQDYVHEIRSCQVKSNNSQHAQSERFPLGPFDSLGNLLREVSPYCIPDPMRSGSSSPTNQ